MTTPAYERTTGLGDFIANEARHAVRDIRQHLFEEAWFGRVVTAEPVMEIDKPQEIATSARQALEEAWGTARHQPTLERDKGRDTSEPQISLELEESLGIDGLRRWLGKEDYDKERTAPEIER